MLEQMRKQGASMLVYLIFCLLIAIFVINFRPGQSRNDDNGCRGTNNVVVDVDGTEATQTAFKVAYSNPYNRGAGKQKVYVALETLIRRELLASAAEARGLRVTEDLTMDEIKKGHFYLGGQRTLIPGIFDENAVWNLKAFKGWVGQLNISQNSYIDEQSRSLLASMMAEILNESVEVSKDEALQRFLYEGNTATYDVVTFKPDVYRSAMKLGDADVDRFLATHEADVKARYKADERTYKAVKPQLQLAQIFIPLPVAPPTDDKKDDKKEPSQPLVGMTADVAKTKLEAARIAIAANKQKFDEAARELASAADVKTPAIDLGWHTADNATLGDKAVNDAVKALKPGEMTPVITTASGSYLVMAVAKREGDLSYDQVKRELATELAKDTWGKEAAKRAAIAILDEARAGTGKNLDQMFEHAPTAPQPGFDIQKLLQDPNLTQEQKQQIIQQLMQQHQTQHGSIEIETKDVPAGSELAGSAGSAGSGSGSGSGSGPAAAPVPVPVPMVEDLTPSKDQIPPATDVAKAHVERFGPAPRSKQMAGLGQSKDAVTAVFDELQPGNLAKRIYEADGAYVVVQVIARAQPNVTDFDKDADRRVAELRSSRGQAFVEEWLKAKCEALAKSEKIKPNAELIAEHDDQGKPLPIGYKPCMSFH